MKVKFANKELKSEAYIVIKNGVIWDIRQDVSDYENDACDIIPIDCRGEIVIDVSNTLRIKEV